MKIATNQDRLNELFDADPRNDTDIAVDLDVSKQAISAWRKGIRSPKKTMLIKIADKYNVSIEWLMGYDVGKNDSQRTIPIVVPDTVRFVELTKCMTNDEFLTVMQIFEKAEQRLKEKEGE